MTVDITASSSADSRSTEPPGRRPHRVTSSTNPGKFLRSVWRTHFYAALLSAPVLLLMALSGLVILYTQPIEGLLHHDVTRVTPGDTVQSLDQQQAAAEARAPEGTHLALVNTARDVDRATVFEYTVDDTSFTDVYVNPYTAEVTGVRDTGSGVVGLANRLHGFLGNDTISVPLPSLAHLIDPTSGPVIQQYALGDLLIEISAGWALVLALSGLYLWWPRRSQKGKALVVPRLRKRGRIRWRDLHAASGIFALATLLVFVITGLSWSGYWGSTWSATADKVTPAASVEVPGSVVAKAGDLDRFGHRISWATREDVVPGSAPSEHQHEGGLHGRDGSPGEVTVTPAGGPGRLGLDYVDVAAQHEGLEPGYSIYLPVNGESEDGSASYGSYQLSNFWPQQIGDEQTVYLDQFSGATLARSGPDSYGGIGKATEVGVLTHMGTQFGVVNTIVMTIGCLLLIFSILTSLVMWWIRRPQGRIGMPRRPVEPRISPAIVGIAIALGVVYPLWGASALTIFGIDRAVRWNSRRRTPAVA